MSLFKKQPDGTTPATAGYIFTERIPHYLKLGEHYVVVTGPVLQDVVLPVGDRIWEYQIRAERNPKEPTLWVRSPFELPKVFWLRKLVTWNEQFEIMPGGDQGYPRQIAMARSQSGAVASPEAVEEPTAKTDQDALKVFLANELGVPLEGLDPQMPLGPKQPYLIKVASMMTGTRFRLPTDHVATVGDILSALEEPKK